MNLRPGPPFDFLARPEVLPLGVLRMSKLDTRVETDPESMDERRIASVESRTLYHDREFCETSIGGLVDAPLGASCLLLRPKVLRRSIVYHDSFRFLLEPAPGRSTSGGRAPEAAWGSDIPRCSLAVTQG